MTESTHLPTAAMVSSYRVDDFDAWKAVFDANEQRRVDNGFIGHHINRSEDDPNQLSIYLAVGDLEAAQAYAGSDQLKALMAEAGVSSPPEQAWMTPLRESVVWDAELPAMMIRHQVEDLDAWLDAYDGADELQRAGGIVGHAANRSNDDPSSRRFDALAALR